MHWRVASLGLVGRDAGSRRRARGCSAIDIAVGVIIVAWGIVNIESWYQSLSALLFLGVSQTQVERTGNGRIIHTVHGPVKGTLVPLGLRVAQVGFQRRDSPLVHGTKVFVHGGFDTVAMILQIVVRICSECESGLLAQDAIPTVVAWPHFCPVDRHQS